MCIQDAVMHLEAPPPLLMEHGTQISKSSTIRFKCSQGPSNSTPFLRAGAQGDSALLKIV